MARLLLLLAVPLLVVPACASAPEVRAEQKESLVQSDVQQAITAHRDALADCAAQQRRANSELKGKLLVTFLIDPSGEAREVAPLDGPLSASVLAACVVRV